VNRRTLLRTGGAALVGLGFGGCATTRSRRGDPAPGMPTQPPINLVPVAASWERVIRTTVGLRPHRPSGFLLKAERLDEKVLIHDYGHGGAGHGIGWGTGFLATELAMQQTKRRAAVIGCGTVGLTAARQLQRHGFDVTIYAASLPPETTSNMAMAFFSPASGLISAARTPEWEIQFRHAAEIGYRELQLLVGSRYGISWIDSYTMSDEEPAAPREEPGSGELVPRSMQTDRIVLGPGEHPFPTTYALRRSILRIEPSIYLDALLADVVRFGGHIVVRKFETPRDLMSLTESVIVNCAGLGSRELFNDKTMVPVKGQLSVLVPQTDVDYAASGGGARTAGAVVSTMPRRDGIVLGTTMERGVETLEPNEESRKRIVDGAVAVFNAMRRPARDRPITTSVPPSQPARFDSFLDEDDV
jgi:D-amino-acid oxidase